MGGEKLIGKNIKNDVYVKFNKHQFEQGIKVSGVASKAGKPLSNKKIKMVAISENEYATYTCVTNAKGEFTIENFNNVGETKINFNEITSDGKSNEIDVVINTINTKEKASTNF